MPVYGMTFFSVKKSLNMDLRFANLKQCRMFASLEIRDDII